MGGIHVGRESVRNRRGRWAGKREGITGSLGRMSFGRLFLGGLLAIPSDMRRFWISTLSTTLKCDRPRAHIGRVYAPMILS